jgi:RNA-binding protein
MQLDKNQIKHLKSIAHSRKPIVMIGQKGLTDNIIKEAVIALQHHELVKIKISMADREAREEAIEAICTKTGASCIQKIGHIAVFFLRNTKQPVIVFP